MGNNTRSFGLIDPWSDTFPDQLVPEIVDMVISMWEAFTARLSGSLTGNREDHITQHFRVFLIQHKNARRLPVSIDRESIEDDLSTGKQKGRIDLRLRHGHLESVYFAFECKRLNVIKGGRRESLSNDYVKAGMMRFITSKYAATLFQGGMIGYVMDGDVPFAVKAVDSSIGSNCNDLRMTEPCGLGDSTLSPTDDKIKETLHHLGDRDFTLHHIFLSC